jgi:hypothetical protein
MSVSTMVWYEPEPILAQQAQRKLRAYESGDLSDFTPNTRLRDFCTELVEAYPVQPSDGGDGSPSIWITAPEVSDSAVVFAVEEERFEEIGEFSRGIASRLGLSCFNSYGALTLSPELMEAPVLRMWTERGSLVYEPDVDTIESMLGHLDLFNWFAILVRGDGWFIQVGHRDDGKGWTLEYQEGSVDRQFQTTIKTLDGVASVFDRFAHGDDSWQPEYAWTKLDLT